MSNNFKEIAVDVPTCDCDITLRFANGECVTVQCRPSNADVNYNGSLDIILPKDQAVTCWQGDDMASAPEHGAEHIRLAKQLVMELPGDSGELA